jgi:hypothetical protein
MNDYLGSVELVGAYLVFHRGALLKADIGAYLKSDAGGQSRLLAYLEALEAVAKGLKVA